MLVILQQWKFYIAMYLYIYIYYPASWKKPLAIYD